MKAEIISIGTEILTGKLIDTHTSFLAGQLSLLGIDLCYASTVGDNFQRLTEVIAQAWQRSDVIITTGGLGPTQDDLTREAIASVLNEKPEVDEKLKSDLIAYYKGRGRDMPASNIKQAMLIPSAKAIQNPRGTAPGWRVEKGGKAIIAMPGPPIEMRFMWEKEIFPRLQKKAENIILSRTLKVFGLGESKVEELVKHLISSPNPTLATYAKQDGTHLCITAKSGQLSDAREMILKKENEVKEILSEHIWGVDDDALDKIVTESLCAKGLSLSVADSYSGGFLSFILTGDPQSGHCFKGGFVTNSTTDKIGLGLDPDLVNGSNASEIVRAMASLVRSKFKTQIGVGMEGRTDSVGGTPTDTVFIAIESEQVLNPILISYSGRHHQMRKRSAYCALFELWKFLCSI